MALVLKKFYKTCIWILNENVDPRSKDFPETSPLFLVGFLGLYFFIVLKLGPKLMSNRKPFNINKLMIVYNTAQILMNLSLLYRHFNAAKKVFQHCVPVDFGINEQALLELSACRHFFWLKMFDCMETLFFVLRKSYRQASFLHLYHHAIMVTGVWVAVRSYGGGHSLMVGSLNTIVHSIMFFYYLLTCIDSSWKQSVAFKRSLTQIQMIQFAIVIYSFGRIVLSTDCAFPRFGSYLMTCQGIFMFALFADFYRKNYMWSNKKEDKQKA